MNVCEAPPVVEYGENPCAVYRDTLEEVFSRILARSDFPLSARLFSMAGFAFEADDFMYAGSTGFSEDRLAVEVNKAADHVYESIWQAEFAGKTPNLELPMSILQSLLLGRVSRCAPEFAAMIRKAWQGCAPESAGDSPESFLRVDYAEGRAHVRCAEMSARYRERRDRLYAAMGAEIDAALSGFCRRFLEGRSPADAPALLAWVQELVLRVMLQKFFLAGDPELFARNKGADEHIRDVVRRAEQHLGQEAQSLAELREELAAQGMQDLSHTGLLIVF